MLPNRITGLCIWYKFCSDNFAAKETSAADFGAAFKLVTRIEVRSLINPRFFPDLLPM
jgi:hypothetical protein